MKKIKRDLSGKQRRSTCDDARGDGVKIRTQIIVLKTYEPRCKHNSYGCLLNSNQYQDKSNHSLT